MILLLRTRPARQASQAIHLQQLGAATLAKQPVAKRAALELHPRA
jgi:hypothetical protein